VTDETHKSLRLELLLTGWAVLHALKHIDNDGARWHRRDDLLDQLSAAMSADIRAAFPHAEYALRVIGPINHYYDAPYYLRIDYRGRTILDTLPASTHQIRPRFFGLTNQLPYWLLPPNRRMIHAVLGVLAASFCRHYPRQQTP
jgi:hypothetical protein